MSIDYSNMILGKTAIVYNEMYNIYGLKPFYYRWRRCNTNLTGNTPDDQYQKLKQIQKFIVHGCLSH